MSALADATMEHVILSGLRTAGRAVEAGEVPKVCGLDPAREVFSRLAALDRLVAQGLVIRTKVRHLNPRWPLLDWVEVTLYRATGGDS